MTVEKIRELKEKFGYSNAQLSRESGVSIGTVNKVLSGASAHPRYETLQALWKVLDARERELLAGLPKNSEEKKTDKAISSDRRDMKGMISGADTVSVAGISSANTSGQEEKISYKKAVSELQAGEKYSQSVKEAEAAYCVSKSVRKSGEYTLEDYYALPDDLRVEMIDGVFYEMELPSVIHQRCVMELSYQIFAFIKANQGNCEVFLSPIDVQLSEEDDHTIVEPDVIVVCDSEKVTPKRIIGAPDLVIEVVSPSGRRRDYFQKMIKYMNAGVREYWLVDPDKGKIMIYPFEQDDLPQIMPLQGKVPVGIYDGKLEIDFGPLEKYL